VLKKYGTGKRGGEMKRAFTGAHGQHRGMRPQFLALCVTALLVLAAEIVFPGCATVTNGVSQDVKVKSRPASADVFLDGKRIGTAPLTARMSRMGFHRLRLEAPGFEPIEIPLAKRLWGWEGLNWFFPPGFVIDLATGAIFELELPKNPPAGISRGRSEEGDTGPPASFIILAELHPQQHGRQISKMKRTQDASSSAR
jgi:hypothetical protein